MNLHIPDDIVKVLGETPDRETLEAILLHLIRTDRVSVAWAGKRLGLDRWEAIEWITSHGEPWIRYTEQELEEDLRYARQFAKQHHG